MGGVSVAILTEVFAHIVTEPKVLRQTRVHLHATPSAPVVLTR